MNGRFNAGSDSRRYNLCQNAPTGRNTEMGRKMNTRFLTTVLGLAIVAIPAVAPANQPDVRLADLKPALEATLSRGDLALLLTDPREAKDFSLVLPAGFTTLDVDADPFAI